MQYDEWYVTVAIWWLLFDKCNVMNSMWYMQYNEYIVLNAI